MSRAYESRSTSRSRCAAACSSARCTTGRRCCSSPRWSCTCSGCSSPARSASRARPTGSSASLLLMLGVIEGFIGYSLPDDLLSGTGLRIDVRRSLLSIPVIGTWIHWLIFGGEFPGTEIIPRLYIVHVLLLPAILLALIAVHVGLVWYQKHTQFPGPAAPRATSSASASCRCSRPRAAGSSPSRSVSSRSWAASSRSTRSGTSARTTPRTSPPARSPTGTWLWTDGCVRILPAVGDLPRPLHDPGGVLPVHPRFLPMLNVLAAVYPWIETQLHQGQRAPQPAAAAAGRPGAHRARRDGHHVLHGAAAVRRQRHHRLQVRHLAERDDVGGPDRPARAAAARLLRRPTGSASACSAATARCSSTASRPASSSACRTVSSSRCTSRSPGRQPRPPDRVAVPQKGPAGWSGGALLCCVWLLGSRTRPPPRP